MKYFASLAIILFVTNLQAQTEEEVLVEWEVQVHNMVMKYEPPRCIKFFWIPGGCPESAQALDFKKLCQRDGTATQNSFNFDIELNVLPKFNWYQKQVKYIYYQSRKLKADSEGNINLTENLEDFLGMEGLLKINDKQELVPAVDTAKSVAYIADFNGKQMSINQSYSGEETELVSGSELQSIIIRKAICPNSKKMKKYGSKAGKIDFAYLMTAITPVPQD